MEIREVLSGGADEEREQLLEEKQKLVKRLEEIERRLAELGGAR